MSTVYYEDDDQHMIGYMTVTRLSRGVGNGQWFEVYVGGQAMEINFDELVRLRSLITKACEAQFQELFGTTEKK